MKTYLSLLLLFFTSAGFAQVFTSDDISATLMVNTTHDSTTCSTNASLGYAVEIQNSFLNDSVYLADEFGNLIYQDKNTTGQNPWSLTVPYIPYTTLSDELVNSNQLFFPFPTTKLVTPHDTLHDIYNIIQAYIPDPCAYAPLNGRMFADNNNNCTYDAADFALGGLNVQLNENLSSPGIPSIVLSDYTDASGSFHFNAQQSWFTNAMIQIPGVISFVYDIQPCGLSALAVSSLPVTNLDIPLGCTSSVDLQADLFGPPAVRPALPFVLNPSAFNTGCDSISGFLKLVPDAHVTYNAAGTSNPPNMISGDTLIWQFANLTNITNSGYWNSFFAGVSFMPDVSVVAGDNLCFDILTTQPSNDVNLLNNSRTVCFPVVNSYDPNLKEVSPGVGTEGAILPQTQKLTYTIHFQNTGSADALNISVIDTLPQQTDPSTLRILGSTHQMTPDWLAPNVVRFSFYNINLPDSLSNEPESHGAIRFEIGLDNNLPVGTTFANTAYIYFDANPAIVTNHRKTTIVQTLGLDEQQKKIGVYPNPVNSSLYFSSTVETARIYNFNGTEILTVNNTSVIDVSSVAAGIYLVKTSSNGSESISKIVVTH